MDYLNDSITLQGWVISALFLVYYLVGFIGGLAGGYDLGRRKGIADATEHTRQLGEDLTEEIRRQTHGRS